MIDYNPVTGESGDCIAVGRGAIAIRLALEKINGKGRKVLVPSNICYAAVLPVIYAGYSPVFCDVDSRSGNVTLKIISEFCYDDIAAAIIPHMYGNPIPDMREIVHFLRSFEVIIIEDCASLMARDGSAFIPGTLGDFVVYSTGYSKTIDIGFGGILFSKRFNLADIEEFEQSFHPWTDDYEREWQTFSRIYRLFRNAGRKTNIVKVLYSNLPETLKESYNFSISYDKKKRIFESVHDLDWIVLERRRQYDLYRSLLTAFADELYVFEEDAVPWRFNLLLDNRKEFIKFSLLKRLPVSDWYPQVTSIFGVDECFVGAEWHEKRIVNFPLMIKDDEIHRICKTLKEFRR